MAAGSTGVKARRKAGLKIRFWSLHHEIVIEAPFPGESGEKERKSPGNLKGWRERSPQRKRRKTRWRERPAGSIMGCRAPGGVRMQKDPLIW